MSNYISINIFSSLLLTVIEWKDMEMLEMILHLQIMPQYYSCFQRSMNAVIHSWTKATVIWFIVFCSKIAGLILFNQVRSLTCSGSHRVPVIKRSIPSHITTWLHSWQSN